jgi:hypothetical protein
MCAKGPAAVILFFVRPHVSHNASSGTTSTSITAQTSVMQRTRNMTRQSALCGAYPRCLIIAVSRVQNSCRIVIILCFIEYIKILLVIAGFFAGIAGIRLTGGGRLAAEGEGGRGGLSKRYFCKRFYVGCTGTVL